MKYIVVNVGCIECGVSSNIVGVFDDKDNAQRISDTLSKNNNWREGGQNDYLVFEMPKLNTIANEYKEFLN